MHQIRPRRSTHLFLLTVTEKKEESQENEAVTEERCKRVMCVKEVSLLLENTVLLSQSSSERVRKEVPNCEMKSKIK